MEIQFRETHLLQIVTKRGKKIFNKEELAEDWCFACKDGGDLMICDYGQVLLLKKSILFLNFVLRAPYFLLCLVNGGSLVIQFQETHLLQIAMKRGKKIFNKEEHAEDWCFECKDGGELMICDYGQACY
ncbi:hypothetical protein RDI58_010368 [Solanum bulbocastanum]|uniref:Uncharacterized protein n=1 Tax=Solanum bulbocastanum TaxID=147425 RepID=A0AAN8TTW6_SOLBU